MRDAYVALYCRLSKAVNGQVESIKRQERWGREYAANAWPDLPVRVFADNNLSAFADDVERPDYNALRQAIRDGEVAYLWSVEQTRLEANRDRWPGLARELDQAGITHIHTNRDGIVRLDEVADIKAILSWHERRRLRQRINDTLGDLAAAGRPSGSTSFGYRHERTDGRSRLVVDESEAATARWMADTILSGWTLSAVARELTARGVTGRRGGTRWTAAAVRRTVLAPTIAGKRVHRGVLVGDGDWDPILDEVTWRRLVALFETRTRDNPNRPARSYLLTGGLAVCECGANLIGTTTTAHAPGKPRRPQYLCSKSLSKHPETKPCGRVYISAPKLEAHVSGLLMVHLRSEAFAARVAAGDPHADDRRKLADRIAGLKADGRLHTARRGRREIDETEWEDLRASNAAERGRLSAELAALPPAALDVDVDAVVDGWPYMTGDEQRHFLGLFLSRVAVGRAAQRGGSGFDTTRVTVVATDGQVL